MAWNPKRKKGELSGAQLNAMLFNHANRTPAAALQQIAQTTKPVEPATVAPTRTAVPPVVRKKTA